MMIQRLNKELQESVRLSDITDEEMRAYYDAHQGEYHKAEMVRIARILSANEADCQKVLELARSKADDSRHFRDLALQHSTDERTKAHGGDLPYFPRTADRQEGDPEIDEALVEVSFSLEMREPLLDKCVRSSDGWNVIRLRGRRKARELSYEDVERQIRHRLHRDRLSEVRDELVTKLRKNAEIVVHDDVLAKVRIDPAPEMPEGPPGHPALFEGRGPGGPPGLAGPQGKVGPGGPGKGPRPLGPGKGPRPLGPPPPAE